MSQSDAGKTDKRRPRQISRETWEKNYEQTFPRQEQNMDKLTIDDAAEFTWGYGQEFFLTTAKGNFVWSDPDYGGNNTIQPFSGSYMDWCKKRAHIPFGRDKGKHFIRDYCGKDVKLP